MIAFVNSRCGTDDVREDEKNSEKQCDAAPLIVAQRLRR